MKSSAAPENWLAGLPQRMRKLKVFLLHRF